jgi:mevalonate kinase
MKLMLVASLKIGIGTSAAVVVELAASVPAKLQSSAL